MLLLGAGGLRWGEAAALRLCDIDFLRRGRAATERGEGGPRVRRRDAEVEQEPPVVLPAFVMTLSPRPPRARPATSCFGRHVPGLPGRPSRQVPGFSVRSSVAVRLTRRSPGDCPRLTPYGRVAGDQRRGESRGRSADARPRLERRSRWTFTPICSSQTLTRWPRRVSAGCSPLWAVSQ